MRLRAIAVIICVMVFSAPITTYAYTAKTEPSDEEYVSKRAAEAAAEAEAHNREQASSVPAENPTAETSHQEGLETEAATGHQPTESRCVVPDLRGDSVNQARNALRRRHCGLGRVTRRRVSGRGVLLVMQQEPRAETGHPAGTRVTVTVGIASGRRS